MDKNQMSGGSGAMAVNPMPSAPPSYEEAVGLQQLEGPTSMPPPMPHQMMSMPMPMPGVAPTMTGSLPPYPVAPTPMSMPSQYAAPITQMPLPTQQPMVTNQQQIPGGVRIVHQHVAFSLGPNPIKMSCPSCQADIKTTTMSDHQPSAHVCCIILCLVGCCLCSCLPYCLSAFLSVHHFCPNCKAYIGTWKG